MYGKSSMETYITICKIANGNFLYGSGNSNRGSASEAWDGEGAEREVQMRGHIYIPMIDSC